MKKSITITIFCLSIMIIVMLIKNNNSINSIFELDDNFWNAFVSELSESIYDSENRKYDGIQENGQDYINYYIKTDDLIQLCYDLKYDKFDERKMKQAIKIHSSLQTTFNNYGYFPRPVYKDYEYGWVSSMDAPVIMVASQMLYEITGDEQYKEFIYRLFDYIFKDTKDHGFNFIDGEDIWPLEYARTNSNKENSYFVLNGSLVGYISLKAISKLYNNSKLDEYLKKVEKTYLKNFDKYHMNDSNWSKYMLNPSTVIPIHYLIFEKKLFEAAYYLNDIDEFKDEYNYRKNMLNNSLHAEFFENNGKYEYYLLRATSPNYYQIDSYSTLLEIYDDCDDIIEQVIVKGSGSFKNRKEKFYENMFANGIIKKGIPNYYKVYSIDGNKKYLLFTDAVKISKNIDNDVKYNISYFDDALYLNDNVYEIKKDLSIKQDGKIIFNLDEANSLHKYFYAIEVESEAKKEIGIGLLIYDDKNVGVNRYYTKLVPGNNLIVFNINGFSDYEKISNINKIVLRLYNNDYPFDSFNIKIGNLLTFSDLKSYYNYVMNSKYKINPQ